MQLNFKFFNMWMGKKDSNAHQNIMLYIFQKFALKIKGKPLGRIWKWLTLSFQIRKRIAWGMQSSFPLLRWYYIFRIEPSTVFRPICKPKFYVADQQKRNFNSSFRLGLFLDSSFNPPKRIFVHKTLDLWIQDPEEGFAKGGRFYPKITLFVASSQTIRNKHVSSGVSCAGRI